jgi:hypothetical protein
MQIEADPKLCDDERCLSWSVHFDSRFSMSNEAQKIDLPKTADEMKDELERLRAENESLKRRGAKGLSMRVSEKGAVSVYGLGRFPVTLYKEQWLRLLEMAEDIRTFINENSASLKTKENTPAS